MSSSTHRTPPPRDARRACEPDHATREAYARGDPPVFVRLAGEWMGNILRYAGTIIPHDEDLAAEAAQETFLAFMESHRNYNPGADLLPWLFGICRRCCSARLRKEFRHTARIVDLAGEVDWDSLAEAERASEPLCALLRREEHRAAHVALEALPEFARTVVYLHVFEEMTFRQIGEALGGVATSTISTRYYKALESLREHLAVDGGVARLPKEALDGPA